MSSVPLPLPLVAPSFGRVCLRPYQERDVDMLIDLSTDPYLPLIGTLPAHADREDALSFIQRQIGRIEDGTAYSFCVADGDTDEALGGINLGLAAIASGRATAGYSVAPRHRGRRVAGHALTALTRFAWSIPELHRIELYIEPWNTGSLRTAESAGYTREGLLRSHQQIGDQRADMVLYAAIRQVEQASHSEASSPPA